MRLLVREEKQSREKVKLGGKAKRALNSAFGTSGNGKGNAEDSECGLA